MRTTSSHTGRGSHIFHRIIRSIYQTEIRGESEWGRGRRKKRPMHPRRLTVSDVFIAGLAILLQPFLCVYTVFTGRRRFLFRFARRPTIESRSPLSPPLFFSLPYFQQSIPPHLDSSAFLFLFPLETLDVGKRTMMPPPLQLSSRNGNFFHLFSFSFFFSLLSSSLPLSFSRQEESRCDTIGARARSSNEKCCYTRWWERASSYLRAKEVRKAVGPGPGTTMYGSWRAGKIALDSSSRRWTIG